MNIPMLLSPKSSIAYLEYDLTVRQALEKFKAHGYTAVPVLNEDGIYKGIVSEGDFLRYILKTGDTSMKSLESALLSDIMKKDFLAPLSIDATPEELTERLLSVNFIPVVDARECFIGIVTRKSLISYQNKKLNELKTAV